MISQIPFASKQAEVAMALAVEAANRPTRSYALVRAFVAFGMFIISATLIFLTFFIVKKIGR